MFGTDDLGRDVFARMLEGTFISMSVGFVAIGIATFLGVAIGGIAGFYGEIKPSGAPLFGFHRRRSRGLRRLERVRISGFALLCDKRRSRIIGAPRWPLAVPGGHNLRRALGTWRSSAFEPFGFSGFASDFGLQVRTPYWREGFLGLACLITLAAFGGAQGRNAEESAADGVSLSAVAGGGAYIFPALCSRASTSPIRAMRRICG